MHPGDVLLNMRYYRIHDLPSDGSENIPPRDQSSSVPVNVLLYGLVPFLQMIRFEIGSLPQDMGSDSFFAVDSAGSYGHVLALDPLIKQAADHRGMFSAERF